MQRKVIEELWHGESDRAPWHRVPGQCADSQNIRFDVASGGAAKRGATEILAASLPGAVAGTDYFWFNIRSAIFAIDAAGNILGWDENGAALTPNIDSAFTTYMSTVVDVAVDLDFSASFDTAVITNRRRVPVLGPAWGADLCLRYIKNGDSGTGSDEAYLNNRQVHDNFESLQDYDDDIGVQERAVVRTRFDSNLDPAGYYLKYTGTPHANYEDGYFPLHGNHFYRIPHQIIDLGGATFNPHATSPFGYWSGVAWTGNSGARWDETTMPMRVVYDEAGGSFTAEPCNWRQRIGGTTKDQEEIGIRNERVVAVAFHDQRLWLMGRGTINASQSNDYFDFWNDNPAVPTDVDRIALNLAQPDLGRVVRAIPLGQDLLVLCEQGQVAITSGDEKLTPLNAKIRRLANFPSKDIPEATSSYSAYVIDEIGDIHEYRWQGKQLGGITYSSVLTVHNRSALEGVTPIRLFIHGFTLFILLDDGTVLTHDGFLQGAELIQSAWGKMSVFESVSHITSWADSLRLVTHDATAGYSLLTYRHRRSAPAAGLLYHPHLDRLEVATGATYDATTNETTVAHSGGRVGSVANSRLVTPILEFLTPLRIEPGGECVFDGDRTSGTHYLGFKYTARVTLSPFYHTTKGEGDQVQHMAVFHHDTSDYDVYWIGIDGDERRDEWQAHRVGQAIVNAPSIESFFHDVITDGVDNQTLVHIESDSPGPMLITAIEYLTEPLGRGIG